MEALPCNQAAAAAGKSSRSAVEQQHVSSKPQVCTSTRRCHVTAVEEHSSTLTAAFSHSTPAYITANSRLLRVPLWSKSARLNLQAAAAAESAATAAAAAAMATHASSACACCSCGLPLRMLRQTPQQATAASNTRGMRGHHVNIDRTSRPGLSWQGLVGGPPAAAAAAVGVAGCGPATTSGFLQALTSSGCECGLVAVQVGHCGTHQTLMSSSVRLVWGMPVAAEIAPEISGPFRRVTASLMLSLPSCTTDTNSSGTVQYCATATAVAA